MELLDNYGMITADGLRDRVTVGTCTPLKISLTEKKKKIQLKLSNKAIKKLISIQKFKNTSLWTQSSLAYKNDEQNRNVSKRACCSQNIFIHKFFTLNMDGKEDSKNVFLFKTIH